MRRPTRPTCTPADATAELARYLRIETVGGTILLVAAALALMAVLFPSSMTWWALGAAVAWALLLTRDEADDEADTEPPKAAPSSRSGPVVARYGA